MATNGAIQVAHQAAPLAGLDDATMQNLISGGDCSRLTPSQKSAYYVARCEAAGLDPRAQPFAFMRLNGKETLYALKAASDQLAAKHGVRLTIVSQATEDGIRVVTVRAEAKDGRVTEEIGALPIKDLKGEALANALMKCVTKAKRRAVLSLCGLGMLDETETETIPGAIAAEPKPRPVPPTITVAAEVLNAKVEPPPEEHPSAVEVQKADVVTTLAGDEMDQLVSPEAVDALWNRLLTKYETKTEAAMEWKEAAIRVFGRKVPDPKNWKRWQMRDVEQHLFPPVDTSDVPF
jgi:hypothetical protein